MCASHIDPAHPESGGQLVGRSSEGDVQNGDALFVVEDRSQVLGVCLVETERWGQAIPVLALDHLQKVGLSQAWNDKK